MPSFQCRSGGTIIYNAAKVIVSDYGQYIYAMTDLMQIISNSTANIKLEITSEDLRHFSNELINRAVNEVAIALKATNEDKLLTREKSRKCVVYATPPYGFGTSAITLKQSR